MNKKLQILNIILCFLTIVACTTEPESNLGTSKLSPKNEFPIEFVSRQVLELDSSYIPPRGGPAVQADSFSVYCIYNRTQDTVWLHTIKRAYEEAPIKNKLIKNIDFGSRTSFHNMKTNVRGISISNDCCPDSVLLFPDQTIFFIGNDYEKQNYDTIAKQIFISRQGRKISIPKTFILSNNGEYIESIK